MCTLIPPPHARFQGLKFCYPFVNYACITFHFVQHAMFTVSNLGFTLTQRHTLYEK